jgi:hypothetical protein
MVSSVRPEKGIPAAVDAVLLKMLEKDRSKRFADVDHLAVALSDAMTGQGAHALRHADQTLAASHTQRTTPLSPDMLPPGSVPPSLMQPAQRAQTPLPVSPQPSGPPPPMSHRPHTPPPIAPSPNVVPRLAPETAPQGQKSRRLWPWVVLGGLVVGGATAALVFTLLS